VPTAALVDTLWAMVSPTSELARAVCQSLLARSSSSSSASSASSSSSSSSSSSASCAEEQEQEEAEEGVRQSAYTAALQCLAAVLNKADRPTADQFAAEVFTPLLIQHANSQEQQQQQQQEQAKQDGERQQTLPRAPVAQRPSRENEGKGKVKNKKKKEEEVEQQRKQQQQQQRQLWSPC